MNTKIIQAEDGADLSRQAAHLFAELAGRAIEERGRFVVALSGGSTPRSLFQLLAGEEWRSKVEWEKVHLFWGDERTVAPDHPDSNYRMSRESLLDPLHLPPANIHRILSEEAPPERAARLYEEEIRRFFELRPGRLPRFDLIFLGLGEDAHTASLFPHTPALEEKQRLVVANPVSSLSTSRITFTEPVINHARAVVFLVGGSAKAEALKNVLEGERRPKHWPAQLIQPTEGKLFFVVDREAASRLTRS